MRKTDEALGEDSLGSDSSHPKWGEHLAMTRAHLRDYTLDFKVCLVRKNRGGEGEQGERFFPSFPPLLVSPSALKASP